MSWFIWYHVVINWIWLHLPCCNNNFTLKFVMFPRHYDIWAVNLFFGTVLLLRVLITQVGTPLVLPGIVISTARLCFFFSFLFLKMITATLSLMASACMLLAQLFSVFVVMKSSRDSIVGHISITDLTSFPSYIWNVILLCPFLSYFSSPLSIFNQEFGREGLNSSIWNY